MSQRSAVRLPVFVLSIVALSVFLVWFWADGHRVFGQNANSTGNQELPVLELNQPINRPVAGGQIHNYRLKLEAGQYVKIEVFQYWISVWSRLYDPAGNLVLELKLHNEDAQTEMLSAIAEQSGDFRLELETQGVKEFHGTYQITLVKRQMATPQDRLLVEADRMQLEAYAMARKGKWESAIPLSEKGVAQYEKVFGANHLELVEPLKLLAVLLMFQGDLVNREKVSKRILNIQELALGPNHLNVTEGLLHLGTTYLGNAGWLERNDGLAKQLFERALKIREALLKPNDMRIAQVASDLGILHLSLSEYTQAEALLRRAMTIAEQELGPASYFVVMRWNDLAEVKAIQGEYAEATAIWARGIEIAEKYHPGSPVYAAMMMNLGRLSLDTGSYDRAKKQFEHALPLYEKFWGQESPNMAHLLTLLGRLNLEQGKMQDAEEFDRRALALREKIFGMNHALVASSLIGLAKAMQGQQKYDEAEAAYLRALRINEKIYSEKDWRWGVGMRDLGKLYQDRGDYAKAEQFIRRALISYEQSLGLNHPYVFEARSDLMVLCLAQGRVNDSLIEQQQAAKISEFSLSRNLLAGSENQKLRYLEKFESEIDNTLSLHTGYLPNQPEALQLAFQTLLRRKGRALDEMGNVLQLLRLRAGSDGAKQFDKLSDKLAQLSRLTTLGAENLSQNDYLAKVRRVNDEIENLQAELSRRSLEFRATITPVTLQSVKEELPVNTALVEFVKFTARKEKLNDKQDEQYAAYIMLPDGALQWTPLGNAAEIDDAIRAWRLTLDPKQTKTKTSISQIKKLARQVDKLVMQPVRANLGKTRHVFIAPDGALNLIPFAALVDESNKYLIENYLFVYLTSGRDLLRLKVKHQSQSEGQIFAISDFDKPADQSVATTANSARPASDSRSFLSSDETMATLELPRLVFALDEGKAIQKLFPQSMLYADSQATETALKQVRRPYFLHLSTHGFFLLDNPKNKENALLRSGLAFAGANKRQSGEDDGILTAFEAAALDLWGTKLVVLSACDTGNGEVKNGEGVFGLRRALVLAGAETQVSSLWKASDQVTQRLMESFYRKLKEKMGRAEALRQAQLEILRDRSINAPYYWANFICIGEWKVLGQ